jgi:hypothetical protein
MSLYDNFICENTEEQCYYVKPFSKSDFAGQNPSTGKDFTESDIKKISNHFHNSCSAKGGKINYCCNPFESDGHNKVNTEILNKYPYIKFNRDQNKLSSIDVCNSKDIKSCPGKPSEWQKPKKYDICKMEGGTVVKGDSNVNNIVNLRKDCFTIHCNPQEPEISLANFIGEVNGEADYTYYDDVNIADSIKLNSVNALIQDYMPKIKNIDRVLIHNDRGETMLHEAVRHGANKVIAFLVGRGADLNKQNKIGDTPLHLAARFDKTNIVYALLNYGTDININNNKGEVPLNEAVKHGSIEMLRILFNHGGNIYQINKDKDNMLHVAIKYAIKDKGKKVKFLVEKGVELKDINNNDLTPIGVAEEMIEEMMQKKNSELILEGFSCVSGFMKSEKHYNEDIPEILTYLQKIAYKQNKNQYQDFITGELPQSSYIEFDYNVCVGGKLDGKETNQNECLNGGGQWKKYNENNDNLKTKVKIEYPNESEISINQMNNNDLYNKKCREPVPVKILPHMTDEFDLSMEDKEKINKINKINNTNNISNNVNKPNNINEGFQNNNIINNLNGNINGCNMSIILFICFVILLTYNIKKIKYFK